MGVQRNVRIKNVSAYLKSFGVKYSARYVTFWLNPQCLDLSIFIRSCQYFRYKKRRI
jgi:hypothetical protein